MPFPFNKKEIASSVALLVVCLVGDQNSRPRREGDLAAAVCDNIAHALIGIFAWVGVLARKSPLSGQNFYGEVLLCGLCGSIIDVDHFISAKSLSLKDATNLPHRPLLHCTSGAVFICSTLLTIAFNIQSSCLYKFGWILIVSALSHHIRDSTRRGFWMWPFGSTKPLPYALYLTAEVLLPHGVSLLTSYIGFPDASTGYPSHYTIV